jgi:hypothetical protein
MLMSAKNLYGIWHIEAERKECFKNIPKILLTRQGKATTV